MSSNTGIFIPDSLPCVGKVRVIANSLNIRNAPNTKARIVGKLRAGSEVDIADIEGGYVWAKTTDGYWIALRYGNERLADLFVDVNKKIEEQQYG